MIINKESIDKSKMKLQNVRADLHTHGWAGQETGKGQIVLEKLGETGRRDLATLCTQGFFQTQNTLIGLVNFGDTRYEKIVNTRGSLGRGLEVYDDHRQRFVGVHLIGNCDAESKWCFVLRGQEIPTDKGHVLILGGDKNIQYEKLDDVLKCAEEMGALRVADHPLAKKGILGKVFSLLTQNGKPLSLGKLTLEDYANIFDGVEVCNSNVPELTEETKKLARKLGKKEFANSDSHDLKRMFSSYMNYLELDFSSWEKLRTNLKTQGEMHFGRNRKHENLWHGISVFYNKIRLMAGWVTFPKYEIE